MDSTGSATEGCYEVLYLSTKSTVRNRDESVRTGLQYKLSLFP